MEKTCKHSLKTVTLQSALLFISIFHLCLQMVMLNQHCLYSNSKFLQLGVLSQHFLHPILNFYSQLCQTNIFFILQFKLFTVLNQTLEKHPT